MNYQCKREEPNVPKFQNKTPKKTKHNNFKGHKKMKVALLLYLPVGGDQKGKMPCREIYVKSLSYTFI